MLGPPLVTRDGVAIEVDTRKAIAMLAYLVVDGPAERDRLADLFWAESSPDRARATLRRTLSALRTGIGGDHLVADRNKVSLTGEHTSDMAEFQSAVDETAGHGHDPADVCAACIAPLGRAADLYRGDFLGAFSIKDSPEFEDWARSVTERCRARAGDTLRRLAMAHAGEGDYRKALAASSRWVDLDDLHEPAHRLTMLLHAWSGDRAGAMQAYRECVAVLDRELGVPPLEETTELYEAILDEDLPPAPGVRRPITTHPAPARPGPSDMIDRQTEVEIVEGTLSAIDAGPSLLLVTGESWMGKTRLLEHIIERARAMGHRVASGRAFRAESSLAYGVVVQLLAGLGVPDDLDMPSWARDELHRLDPRLVSGEERSESGQFGQVRLREAFLQVIETIGAKQPLVITIDDAQWTDPASAGVLAYVQRRTVEARLLTVVSTRSVETMQPDLRDLAEDATATLALRPLAVGDLKETHPGQDLDSILSATGGIPILVQEALVTGGVDPESSNVSRYVESRRQRMSELGRQVLAAAAVLNGMCDASVLKDTSGRNEEEVVDAVEELVSLGLLREQDDGRLTFTVDVLESMTYDSTSLTRRRLLHRRAADALAARPRSPQDARVVRAIAEHQQAAGSDEAASSFRRAGDLARRVYAYDEAQSSYELALALGVPEVAETHLALGELAMVRGEYESATRELRTAASHAQGPALALVEHRIGDLDRILGRFELAAESFARAESDHPRPADLYADWALLEHRLGHREAAEDLAEKARAAASESGDDRALARALNILGLVAGDPKKASDHIDEALALAESDEPARIAALNNKAHLLAGSGDLETALSLVGVAIELSARLGYRHQQAALHNHLADLHHQAGEEEEARASLTEAVKLFADVSTEGWAPEVWFLSQW